MWVKYDKELKKEIKVKTMDDVYRYETKEVQLYTRDNKINANGFYEFLHDNLYDAPEQVLEKISQVADYIADNKNQKAIKCLLEAYALYAEDFVQQVIDEEWDYVED